MLQDARSNTAEVQLHNFLRHQSWVLARWKSQKWNLCLGRLILIKNDSTCSQGTVKSTTGGWSFEFDRGIPILLLVNNEKWSYDVIRSWLRHVTKPVNFIGELQSEER